MNRHTPGPWVVTPDSETGLHSIWQAPDMTILIARTCFAPDSRQNAELIKEAPALWSVMRGLSDLLSRWERRAYGHIEHEPDRIWGNAASELGKYLQRYFRDAIYEPTVKRCYPYEQLRLWCGCHEVVTSAANTEVYICDRHQASEYQALQNARHFIDKCGIEHVEHSGGLDYPALPQRQAEFGR